MTQLYSCVMVPCFNEEGNLPEGIHWATWQEFITRFGINSLRRRLITGMKAALDSLKFSGCQTVYIDGSFVTAKENPNDYDGCWDGTEVDPMLLDPVLLMFDAGRAAQKLKFRGELFPLSFQGTSSGPPILEFFQVDKDTGDPKGIVALDLRRFS